MEKNIVKPKTLPGFMELLPDEQILFNEMKEKLTNTEVALKQAEMYYDAYKQNIEKYIENE